MMAEKQIDRMLQKLERFEITLSERIFQAVGQVEMKWFQTKERLHSIPDLSMFSHYMEGAVWGGAGTYCWFRGTYVPSEELQGKRLYLYPRDAGYEAMLWVNGAPTGIYAAKFVDQSHGNHYCDMLTDSAEAGNPIDIAIECYAGNFCIGSRPLENEETRSFEYTVGSMDICLKDSFYSEFLFDLKVLNQMAAALDKNSSRRADILRTLIKVHELVYYSYEDTDEETFRKALVQVHPYIKEALAKKNSPSAPYAGIIGHSHMDTAWLWTIDETGKKCARTYANQLSLMEQYPEYLFVQSSAYHTEMVRRNYPELFQRIARAVADGRYEPNGGVWVEGDCNIPTGEMMARQFLWGQRYTQKYFGYTSDTFWLPDTFGYSAAIPQIMKLSGVKYFLTTKIAWNDTNQFPYDSFWWRGIDGTEVLTHFNKTHVWPDPKNLVEYVVDGKNYDNCVREKTSANMRLISFGYGDGGGGPQFEMIEMARRTEDLEGLPRTGYTTVSQFMKKLEAELFDPSIYSGELYLELHRGTLTNQHNIKRNNRLAEIALHNLEYFTVRDAVKKNIKASSEQINPLTEVLLVNQFHDILPGTSIPEVHEQSLAQTNQMIQDTDRMSRSITRSVIASNNAIGNHSETNKDSKDEDTCITISNTTSFKRDDVVYIDNEHGMYLNGDFKQQIIHTMDGKKKLAISGIVLEPYSSKTFVWTNNKAADTESTSIQQSDNPVHIGAGMLSSFKLDGKHLETPFLSVVFDEYGYIQSLKDKTAQNRELCHSNGYSFNTFLLAEDVPLAWDNWDIDADLEYKYKPIYDLESREVVSDGCVELRIRSTYVLTPKSKLVQDMIFYSDSAMIRFETKMDWQDHHRFLKTSFDTAIHANEARHEIQFGYVKRPTTRNNDIEKAKFEVCAHKYSDLSEMRYGIAILNDCKYGISVKDSSMRLSLHKGGNRPDYKGDLGVHECVYALIPHNAAFSAETTVKPAYLLNYRHFITEGRYEADPLLQINTDHIIAETIKPCEDEQNAYILRLYECEGASVSTDITVFGAKRMILTDMLEEAKNLQSEGETIQLSFRPFEIKTVKVIYM